MITLVSYFSNPEIKVQHSILIDCPSRVTDFNRTDYIFNNAKTDQMEHLQVSNKKCQLPKFLIGHHHKAGGYVWRIYNLLQEECGFSVYNRNYLDGFTFKVDASYNFLKEIEAQNKKIENVVFIQLLREPLDTILSGYNYHKSGHEAKWTKAKLGVSAPAIKGDKLLSCYCDTRHIEATEIFPPSFFPQTSNEFLCPSCGSPALNPFHKKKDESVYSAYNSYNTSYGLYLEFLRYMNCEWPHYYLSNKILDKVFAHYFTVYFEDFRYGNFSQAVVSFLQNLRVPPAIFRKKNGLYDKIMKGSFASYNTSDLSKERRDHIQFGRYDIEEQKALLLRYDIRVCKKIKQFTVMMSYKWRYAEFC